MDKDFTARRTDNGEQFRRGYTTALIDAIRALNATQSALSSQGKVFTHSNAVKALDALLKGLGESND